MNPELPAPQVNPEYQAPRPESPQQFGSHETVGEKSHEQERAPSAAEQTVAPPPIPVPLPPQVVPVPAMTVPVDDTTVGPSIAADDDLIEKEWVDQAKKIIANTRDDPYRREQEVSRLQADYLRKRYGKELGVSE